MQGTQYKPRPVLPLALPTLGLEVVASSTLTSAKDGLDIGVHFTKTEAGQMNNHCGWFESIYGTSPVKRVLIIPTRTLSKHANFTHEVYIMRKGRLRDLKRNVKSFFKEFKDYKIDEISDEKLQQFIIAHELDIDSLWTKYVGNYHHET